MKKKNISLFSLLCILLFGNCDSCSCHCSQKKEILSPNGDKYFGQLKNDKYHGKGTLSLSNGSIYEGIFQNGILEKGKCQIVFPKNDKFGRTLYVGECANNEANGYGMGNLWDNVIDKNPSKVEGHWQNGMPNGECKLIWENGAYFKGKIINGKSQGKGIFKNIDGYTLEGNWIDDSIEGEVRILFPKGSKFLGNFVKGKAEGKGLYLHPDGTRYESSWKNGVDSQGKVNID